MECPDVQSPVGKSKLARLGHCERLGIAAHRIVKEKECSRRVSFPPPRHPVGTLFSLRSTPAGTAQNAGLSAHLSEPRRRAPRPILGHFLSLFGPFL
jgi:hypothetical protein